MLETYVDPTYAKGQGYFKDISEILKAGICPFCPDVFPGTWHKNPILQKYGDWLITRNMYPYEGSSDHLIIVGRNHVENLSQLSPKDTTNILYLAQWAAKEFNLPGGFLGMRFGDSKFTGATVKHLHAHLVVPKENGDGKIAVVNFPIG